MKSISWSTISSFVIQAIYQASRYALATCVTAGALAIFPLFIVLLLGIIGIIIAFIFSFLLVGSLIAGDFPMATMFFIVATPVAAIIVTIIALIAITVISLLFTVLIVLPTSFLVDVMLRFVPIRSRPFRGIFYFIAGGFVGIVGATLLFISASYPDRLILSMLAFLLIVICIISTTVFGLVLMTVDGTKMLLSRIVTKFFIRVSPLAEKIIATIESRHQRMTNIAS